MIPQDVTSYLNAQGWLFMHVGLPALGVAACALIAVCVQRYRDDCNVNDDTPRESSKILNL